ncbi:MAG: GTPase, partial [Nanoarchaeota archaeon]
GFPSSGKSTLLNKLTDAHSEVAAYAFTTLTVIPGMMEYKQAKIQILDVPGIVSGAASGRGRGKEVLTVIRNADLVLMVIDVTHPEHHPSILKEVWDSNIRLNKTKPEVFIKKRSQGGINIGKTVPIDIEDETIKQIMREFKQVNADVLIRSPIDVDDFIDIIEGNKKYLPAITCITKSDLTDAATVDKVKRQLNADLAISAEQDLNIEPLKELIFQKLDFMRIYLKEPRKGADLNMPLIIRRNCTIRDVCEKLHKDFAKKFRFARVWGKSTKFPGQKLMLNHTLNDQDILELHIR